MDWIKRNLFFVVFAGVALVLLGVGGFYTWSGYNEKGAKSEKLNQSIADLKRLVENQYVGSSGDGKTDNITTAREQQDQIKRFLKNANQRFQLIQPIPEISAAGKVDRDVFASQLRLTIDQLQRDATNNSVVLRAGYNFSFEAQRRQPQPVPASLPLLAVQLGEVKAIATILHQAKINYLDSIRRERVSTDDDAGQQTDYLAVRSQTNELAVLTPYEVTFRCFSPELGAVVAGFANSPHGFIVKNINVEPGTATADVANPFVSPPVQNFYQPPPPPPPISRGEGAEDRYGGKGFGPPAAAVAPRATYAPPASKAMPIMVNEKQLKVTILIHVVKLLPAKQSS